MSSNRGISTSTSTLILIVITGVRRSVERFADAVQSVVVMIRVQKAFERYAAMLKPPGEWEKLMRAVQWFRQGSRVRRLWRHRVYRWLWPCQYEERRLQCEEAKRQMKRAMLMAAMDRLETAKPCWQNWRMN